MFNAALKSDTLKARMARGSVIRCLGAHDALSARIGQEEGFEAVWASGLGVSSARGVPDANILGMQDMLQAAWSIDRAVNVPVIADCDIGFGDAGVVSHMVREFEQAGIAGVCIEDKVFPKLNSFANGRQELAPIGQFAGKIAAAKNAQRSDSFQVFARVEALIAGLDVATALERARAYAAAGADAILIHSKAKAPDEIVDFINRWDRDLPLVLVPTTYPSLTLATVEALQKVRIVIYANQALRAGIRAMRTVLASIRQTGSTVAIEEDIATVREVFELQDMPAFLDTQQRYGDLSQMPAAIAAE
jgi:phosphoenolpyruvate phosphomutase